MRDLTVLDVNEYIAAAEEALQNNPEYKQNQEALYAERQRIMDKGLMPWTIEGILYEKWWRILKYAIENASEIEKPDDEK